MRLFRTAVLIIGLFQPLVIPAQPYGTTELTVFDTDFLVAPPAPAPEPCVEPPLPSWVELSPLPYPTPWVIPPILLPELPL